MGDFTRFNTTLRINEILPYIDLSQDTIILNNNFIKRASLQILPYHIVNVYLNNNSVSKVEWDDRPWKTICLKNNNMDVGEFNGLNCDKLILDDNDIKEITFVNCKINHLSIMNNKITNINFFDCHIERLDLSVNKIQKIITLPSNLKVLKLDNNKIQEILISLSDTIIILDLSDNKLEKIKNIPSFLKHLDLSKNNFKSFDPMLLPNTLEYFDITENKIYNNFELFNELRSKILKIYYDTDNENDDDTKITDELSEVSELSDVSDLSSIKFNYLNEHLSNNYKELKIDSDNDSNSISNNHPSDFDDEEINNAINEYKNGIKETETENEHNYSGMNNMNNINIMNNTNNDYIKESTIENNDFDINKNSQNKLNLPSEEPDFNFDSNNILSQRDLMIKAAILRLRNKNKNNIEIKKKVFLPLENVELKWNINLL